MSRGKKERRKKGKKSFYVAGKRGKSCCHLAADVIVEDEVDVDVIMLMLMLMMVYCL